MVIMVHSSYSLLECSGIQRTTPSRRRRTPRSWTRWQHQTVYALILFGILVRLTGSLGESIPREFPDENSSLPIFEKQISNRCQYPCKCTPPQCKAGVNIKKDGCGCCFICTRQQGDLCDAKYICDEDKGLYCDFKFDGGLRGICRAKAAKPCNVDGNIYKDGEEFKLNCSQLCTCQNGQYACSTLCPQEDRPPSAVHCKEPILVQIESRCCREWVCPHSHSLPGPDDTFPPSNKSPPKECKKETTEWSACSQTCGMGVSIRVTNENRNCETMQERRLCFVRPCDMNDRHLTGHWCKNTWRNSTSIHFVIDGCRSVKDYRPKYCATCKKHRCCYPEHSETREMEFECTGRVKYRVEKFMWIKNCVCRECH